MCASTNYGVYVRSLPRSAKNDSTCGFFRLIAVSRFSVSPERHTRVTMAATTESGGVGGGCSPDYRPDQRPTVAPRFFIGNSNRPLFAAVADNLGASVVKATVGMFANGNTRCELYDSVRGHVVVICQTEAHNVVVDGVNYTCNDLWTELEAMIATVRLSSAKEIVVLMPSYFNARSDKRDSRCPIMAKENARKLEQAGATRVVSLDIHSGQIQGFFNIPMDNLYAIKVLTTYLETLMSAAVDREGVPVSREQYVLLSMDAGGEKRIKAYSDMMRLPYVICTKQRDYTTASTVVKTNINCPSEFIKGKILIAVDDMIDTAGTIKSLVKSLKADYEFTEIWTVFSHGIFSGNAVANIKEIEGSVTKVIVTNSVDQTAVKAQLGDLLHVVDISDLLAEVIDRMINGGSISELFH